MHSESKEGLCFVLESTVNRFYLDGFADGYFGLLYPAQSFVKVNSKVLDLIFLGESFTVQK